MTWPSAGDVKQLKGERLSAVNAVLLVDHQVTVVVGVEMRNVMSTDVLVINARGNGNPSIPRNSGVHLITIHCNPALQQSSAHFRIVECGGSVSLHVQDKFDKI